MRQYRSHKIVEAAQIVSAGRSVDDKGIDLALSDGENVHKDEAWHLRHRPVAGDGAKASDYVGGYLVVYPDGYSSFSPKDAFEQGYTVIP